MQIGMWNGLVNSLFEDTSHRFGPGGDLFSIVAAGLQAQHGHSIYSVGGHVSGVPYCYGFRYAPIVAYVMAVTLCRLPAVVAYGLWRILCEMTLLKNILLTWDRSPDRKTAMLTAAMWLAFTPYFIELFVGQFTFVAVSISLWAQVSWQDGETSPRNYRVSRRGDLFWAAAFWLQMMPGIFIPIALLRGRYKGVVAGILVLLATSVFYFTRCPADWLTFLSPNITLKPTPGRCQPGSDGAIVAGGYPFGNPTGFT